MRAFTILLVAMVLAPVSHRAHANSVTDQGAGFLSYKHKKETKGFFVVRAGRAISARLCRVSFQTSPLAQSGAPPT